MATFGSQWVHTTPQDPLSHIYYFYMVRKSVWRQEWSWEILWFLALLFWRQKHFWIKTLEYFIFFFWETNLQERLYIFCVCVKDCRNWHNKNGISGQNPQANKLVKVQGMILQNNHQFELSMELLRLESSPRSSSPTIKATTNHVPKHTCKRSI